MLSLDFYSLVSQSFYQVSQADLTTFALKSSLLTVSLPLFSLEQQTCGAFSFLGLLLVHDQLLSLHLTRSNRADPSTKATHRL